MTDTQKNTNHSVIRKFKPAAENAEVLVVKVKKAETRLRKSIRGEKSA